MRKKNGFKEVQIGLLCKHFKEILPTEIIIDGVPIITLKHDLRDYAEFFYEAGFRKLQEDCVILTKAEYEFLTKRGNDET